MAITNGLAKKYLDINAYSLTEKLKKQINFVLEKILSKYNKLELKDVIYTVVKELVINATKANIKRIVFAENNLDIDNLEEWEKGTAIFKEKLTEDYINEFSKKTKSLNYNVKIRYIYNETGMRIEVINNTPIPKIDNERMRKKLKVAMGYDSIADYYMDNADNAEGAGMGLALIIILLKGQGIDPQYLRIGNDKENTIARIEIPFNDSYVPYRDIKYKEKLEKENSI